MRKLIAGAGLAGVMAFGGLSVAAVSPLSIAGGQPSASAPAVTASSTTAATQAQGDGPLAKALAGLVADKTITQAQADAVTAAVKAQVAEARKAHPGWGRHRARRLLKGTLGVAAKEIGVPRQQLVAGLKAGKSIAAQAQAKGIDPAKVEQALVTAGTKRIDQALAAKRIDADQAAKLKERLPERAKLLVERTPKPHG